MNALDTPKLYKVLNEDGTPCWGGSGRWLLPAGGKPGRWMPRIDGLVPYERGYHVCTLDQLPIWFGPTIYVVEVRGERIDLDDKSVVSSARLLRRIDGWNERTARLFAVDCAERGISFYETLFPDDKRPRSAITAARAYARGEIDRSTLAPARWAAEQAVLEAAALAPVTAAAVAMAIAASASAASAVGWKTYTVARSAAYSAAYPAAAERLWQARRLAHYLYDDCTHAAGDCSPVSS